MPRSLQSAADPAVAPGLGVPQHTCLYRCLKAVVGGGEGGVMGRLGYVLGLPLQA